MAKKDSDAYIRWVRKTTLVIDDDQIRRAAEVLGTRGIKATIDRALEEAISRAARYEAFDQMTDGTLELHDADVMNGAWR
jgi:Arc/MetJ family transcription regulator